MTNKHVIILLLFQGIFQFTPGQKENPDNNLIDRSDHPEVEKLIAKAEYFLESNPDSARILAKQAYQMALDRDNNLLSYKSAKLIADARYYSGDLVAAVENYRQAADIIRGMKGEFSTEYASRISDVGFCFNELNVSDLAIEYFNRALKIFIYLEDTLEISNQLNNIGYSYFAQGNFNLATEYFSRTLQYDLKTGDSTALSTTYNNIGKVYETWGYYELAIEHYTRSLDFLSENSNDARRSIRLSNIGTSLYELGDYNKALKYLEEALNIEQKLENQYKIAVRMNEIANVFAVQGKYGKAIEQNELALQILDSIGRSESMVIVLNDLGTFHMKNGNYLLAKIYFEKSIGVSRDILSVANEMKSYEKLSELMERMKKYVAALHYHKKYDSLKETIFTIQTHEQLANYRIRYETEKKERENLLLKQDILNKEQTQRALIIIGVMMFVTAVLLFYLLRLKNRTIKQNRKLHEQDKRLSILDLEKKEIEKQQLQERVFAEKQVNRLQREKYETELNLKNRELVNSILQLVNKNEVLSEIKHRIKSHDASISTEAYQDLLQLVNQNTDFDQNWKKFRVEFEKLHPGFLDRIKNAHPEFSDPFIRLSAFLRIDLSSREIARLMNVSVAAVNKNRQRLRKRLNLEAEADLGAFMKRI